MARKVLTGFKFSLKKGLKKNIKLVKFQNAAGKIMAGLKSKQQGPLF